MRILTILSLLLCLSACTRIDKNPELRDPVYMDIQNEIQTLKAELEGKTKELLSFKKELLDVVPQTGQIKFVQKRINETEAHITHLEQEILYYELRKESRAEDSRKAYHESLKASTTWPDPKEYDSYLTEKKLRLAKKSWNVKSRTEDLGLTPKVETPVGH